MPAACSTAERLASLLEYPDPAWRARLTAVRAEVGERHPGALRDLDRFAREVSGLTTSQLQEVYVQTFDMHPACTLDVGWHLFGEAYERGAFMAYLRDQLERAEIDERNELPDHLPSIVALLDRLGVPEAAALREQIRPALDKLEASLAGSSTPYVHLLRSIRAAAGIGG